MKYKVDTFLSKTWEIEVNKHIDCSVKAMDIYGDGSYDLFIYFKIEDFCIFCISPIHPIYSTKEHLRSINVSKKDFYERLKRDPGGLINSHLYSLYGFKTLKRPEGKDYIIANKKICSNGHSNPKLILKQLSQIDDIEEYIYLCSQK